MFDHVRDGDKYGAIGGFIVWATPIVLVIAVLVLLSKLT